MFPGSLAIAPPCALSTTPSPRQSRTSPWMRPSSSSARTGGPPCLRFWEPDRAFVVLGYTNRAAAEVNLQECRARSIPVLRRMTGGGTVLQAPGVLNYNLVLPLPPSGPLSTIGGTNRYVLSEWPGHSLRCFPTPPTVRGDTDLALEGGRSPATHSAEAGEPSSFTARSFWTST